MSPKKTIRYPWFHFIKVARLSALLFFGAAAVSIYFTYKTFPEMVLRIDHLMIWNILPICSLAYFLFLFSYYHLTKRLGNIIYQIESFKNEIPYGENLKLLYKQDEWAHLDEALKQLINRVDGQVHLFKDENEKFTAILESINDHIIAVDQFESILFYNSKFKAKFIDTRARTEITSKLWHYIENEDIVKAFKKVLRDGETIVIRDLVFSTKSQRIYNLTISPLRKADKQIVGALGVLYDVTEMKRTEQMRVDFVANVSHEIRTPLTSIKGFTQLLEGQKSKIDPSLHVFLEKILFNTERMISLFNDLLNLSVIESQNKLTFDSIDISPLIESVAQSIQTNYRQKSPKITLDLQVEKVLGNEKMIEQVVTNLLDNACKYSDSPVVYVSTYYKGASSFIKVSDNGPGISDQHLERIFERFYRVDASRETQRGTGLGLSIVKHIINKHNGKIWAEKNGEQGTSFIIELPTIS
jgi:two-component system phosphate regulon sensor histidine kinase PhoR